MQTVISFRPSRIHNIYYYYYFNLIFFPVYLFIYRFIPMQITRTPAPVPGRNYRPGAVDRQRICAKKTLPSQEP